MKRARIAVLAAEKYAADEEESLNLEWGWYPNAEQWVTISLDNESAARLITDEHPKSCVYEEVWVDARFSDAEALDSQYVRLALTLEVARRLAERVVLVCPYFPYSLQDRDVHGGNARAFVVWTQLLQSMGVSAVVTATPHSQKNLQAWSVPVTVVPAERLLADAVRATYPDDRWAVVAPDKSATAIAQRYAELVNGESYTLQKERLGAGKVRLDPHQALLVRPGRSILLVDDMINTGSTLIEATRLIREQLGSEVRVCVVVAHGLFAGEKWRELLQLGVERTFVTDSFSAQVARSRESDQWLTVVKLAALVHEGEE